MSDRRLTLTTLGGSFITMPIEGVSAADQGTCVAPPTALTLDLPERAPEPPRQNEWIPLLATNREQRNGRRRRR